MRTRLNVIDGAEDERRDDNVERRLIKHRQILSRGLDKLSDLVSKSGIFFVFLPKEEQDVYSDQVNLLLKNHFKSQV